MSKHTPGPWTIGALESGQAAVDGANGEEVTGFISPADAALIAAAPDMLAELKKSRTLIECCYWAFYETGNVDLANQCIRREQEIATLIARAKGTP
jgi:hypothetical protein